MKFGALPMYVMAPMKTEPRGNCASAVDFREPVPGAGSFPVLNGLNPVPVVFNRPMGTWSRFAGTWVQGPYPTTSRLHSSGRSSARRLSIRPFTMRQKKVRWVDPTNTAFTLRDFAASARE